MKADKKIVEKYKISDNDLLVLFTCWKDEFMVALDDVKAKAQIELIENLQSEDTGNIDLSEHEVGQLLMELRE